MITVTMITVFKKVVNLPQFTTEEASWMRGETKIHFCNFYSSGDP